MRNCLPCQLFWLRLRSIPASSGRWGKFLSSVIAAAWAATLWNHGPGLAELAGEAAIIDLFGLHAAATWMTIVAVAPIAGMLSGVIPLPPDRNKYLEASWSVQVKSPIGPCTATRMPGRICACSHGDTSPRSGLHIEVLASSACLRNEF